MILIFVGKVQNMKEFIINQNDAGQRIDKFLLKAMPDLPKSMMYRLIRKKDIKINGKRCEISDKLENGDVVRVYVKDELSSAKVVDQSFKSSSDQIDVIYEDKNIIIVFKPVGVDPHSGSGSQNDTMIDRIKLYLYNKNDYIPDAENSFSPALCNRLDRNTAGLMIAAKNAETLREVNSAIRNGDIHKIYHCVTVCPPPHDNDIITAWHKKDEGRNMVRISGSLAEGFKEIKTGYKVISKASNGQCLVEITLYTGRTHQIRAHMAHIGAPLLGDGKYGNIAANKRYGVFRQLLCACGLSFSLPDDSPLSYLNELDIKAPQQEFEKKFS